MSISRRTFLKAGVGIGVLSGAGVGYRELSKTKTNAKILIVGGGAAGIGMANKLNQYLSGAEITVVEPRNFHWYQPGQTLLLAGSYTQTSDVMAANERYISGDVRWVEDAVIEYRPDHNQVVTQKGNRLDYDYLIVATGVELRYDLIEGFDTQEIGHNGITSIYYSPETGLKSHQQALDFAQRGEGKVVCTRPQGAMKCAGAPMKATNLLEYFVAQAGNREHFTFDYFTAEDFLFSVPVFDQRIREIWVERQIHPHFEHTLTALDSAKKQATFIQPDGRQRVVDWDFIHVAPPMTAIQSVRESPLADQNLFKGYLEVDKFTMQHSRYANVFGIGDTVGTPIGKTAASVKSQLPVVAQNLTALIEGREPQAKWDGYTSCPMILDVGHAMLWEFNYSLKPVTALHFHVVDPLKKSKLAWVMEESMIKPVYDMMLHGYSPI
ncbi:NAD(P)/FAD-dependent oxidoreductase [Vibrio cincinnatiensis]|uniref:NAD(P)/FAD-dependent oxidoreductase n=1 Tax=Vibrio cincinnatiensis TaxID=675 RepID=UPI001EE0B6DB|nr:FAD-dependent oxidoreductase [Vibrio cincinnatiensis]